MKALVTIVLLCSVLVTCVLAQLPFVPKPLFRSATLAARAKTSDGPDQMTANLQVFLDAKNQKVAIQATDVQFFGGPQRYYGTLLIDYKANKEFAISNLSPAGSTTLKCEEYAVFNDNFFEFNSFEHARYEGLAVRGGKLVSLFTNVLINIDPSTQFDFAVALDAFTQAVTFVEGQFYQLNVTSYVEGVSDPSVFDVPQGMKCEKHGAQNSLLRKLRK